MTIFPTQSGRHKNGVTGSFFCGFGTDKRWYNLAVE